MMPKITSILSILLKQDPNNFSKLYSSPESDRHPIMPQLRTTSIGSVIGSSYYR